MNLIMNLLSAAICLTVHNFAQAAVSLRLGNFYSKYRGYLTFSPSVHLNWPGYLVAVFLGYGWANPVPVDRNTLNEPKSHMTVSVLAGPLSEVLLACICAFLYGLTGFGIFYNIITMAAGIAVFSLIPVPPLDGSKLIKIWTSFRYPAEFNSTTAQTVILLVVILVFGKIIPVLAWPRHGLESFTLIFMKFARWLK